LNVLKSSLRITAATLLRRGHSQREIERLTYDTANLVMACRRRGPTTFPVLPKTADCRPTFHSVAIMK
jgi:hypothetical protein